MHCYNCGKNIKPTESSISLDGINHSHDSCLRSPPKPAQCRFDELAIGEEFHLAITQGYGSKQIYMKASCEMAGTLHSPQRMDNIPADTQVVRVRDTSISEPEKHPADMFTLAALKTSDYAFSAVLKGNEHINIHSSTGWNCLELANKHIWLCINQHGKYCFVFSDEAEQFSQPYPTVGEAKQALIRYMTNL